MATSIANVICLAALGYAVVGAAIALAFVARGIARVDPAAKGSGWVFRALIFAGAAALWPLMLAKWRRALREANP